MEINEAEMIKKSLEYYYKILDNNAKYFQKLIDEASKETILDDPQWWHSAVIQMNQSIEFRDIFLSEFGWYIKKED